MSPLANQIEGIRTVSGSSERDILFPAPATGQKVFNRTAGAIEEYNGSAWLPIFGGTTVFDATVYGAVGDGVTDDTAAILACIAAAKAYNKPCRFLLPQGIYLVSATLNFDLPDYSTITFVGAIRCQTAGITVVRFGPTTAATNAYGYKIDNLDIYRESTIDLTGSIGVEFRNLAWATIHIKRVLQFTIGAKFLGADVGYTYCQATLGFIHDNQKNVVLEATGAGGYCNENNFYGGSFNHTSSWNSLVASWNLYIAWPVGASLNNNRFFGPSFEDYAGALAVAAFIDAENVLLIQPRMEGGSGVTYPIQFGVHSLCCEIIGVGAGVQRSQIFDLGTENKFMYREGRFISMQGTAAGDVLFGGSGSSSEVGDGIGLHSGSGNSRVLSVRDTGRTLRGYITGDGYARVTKLYANDGPKWNTGNGTFEDAGIYIVTGSPEGTQAANPNSLAVNQSTGEWYRKTTGGNSTGWNKLVAMYTRAGTPEANITAPVGDLCIDTTNHKLYFKETGTGNTGWVILN